MLPQYDKTQPRLSSQQMVKANQMRYQAALRRASMALTEMCDDLIVTPDDRSVTVTEMIMAENMATALNEALTQRQALHKSFRGH